MLGAIKLLLPALFPSWRFFDTIAPSPRIEYTLLQTPESHDGTWQEFRPKPTHIPPVTTLKRLFHNPQWNETLFLVSCAERIMDHPTTHSITEITTRIESDINKNNLNPNNLPLLQFRLAFVSRHQSALQKDITFMSPSHALIKGTPT